MLDASLALKGLPHYYSQSVHGQTLNFDPLSWPDINRPDVLLIAVSEQRDLWQAPLLLPEYVTPELTLVLTLVLKVVLTVVLTPTLVLTLTSVLTLTLVLTLTSVLTLRLVLTLTLKLELTPVPTVLL